VTGVVGEHAVISLVDEVERVLRSLRGVWDEEAVDELDHGLHWWPAALELRRCDDGAKDPAAPVPGLHWALDAVRRVAEQRTRGPHGHPRGAGS